MLRDISTFNSDYFYVTIRFCVNHRPSQWWHGTSSVYELMICRPGPWCLTTPSGPFWTLFTIFLLSNWDLPTTVPEAVEEATRTKPRNRSKCGDPILIWVKENPSPVLKSTVLVLCGLRTLHLEPTPLEVGSLWTRTPPVPTNTTFSKIRRL